MSEKEECRDVDHPLLTAYKALAIIPIAQVLRQMRFAVGSVQKKVQVVCSLYVKFL